MASLYMLIGLPGCGKSTYAKTLAAQENALIVSSDDYRGKYGSGEDDQSVTKDIFKYIHSDVVTYLKNDLNVIFDATNVVAKKRRNFIKQLKQRVQFHSVAVLVLATYKECLERALNRDRRVPEYVIQRMYQQFDVPSYHEGFDELRLYFNTHVSYSLQDDFFTAAADFNQENPHHTLKLFDHCRACYTYVNARGADHKLATAALLHDCGKLYTKTYDDNGVAHYYNHEHVGAYESFFYMRNYYNAARMFEVAFYINKHMLPFQLSEEKLAEKYDATVAKKLMLLHEADLNAK